ASKAGPYDVLVERGFITGIPEFDACVAVSIEEAFPMEAAVRWARLLDDPRNNLSTIGWGDEGEWLLRTAGECATLSTPSADRALWAVRTWVDSWTGIGHVAVGMHRQGFDLQLTQYDERGWRATFYTTGMEHSPTRRPAQRGRVRCCGIRYC